MRSIPVRHGKILSQSFIINKSCGYISDANDMSIINIKELNNLNYLIIDCLKFYKHPTHYNLDDALFIRKHLNPKKTILTNLHHDIDYHFLLRKLPKNVLPAYDGLKINL